MKLLESASSTNDVLKGLARGGAPPGTVLVAEEQTAGRGRLNRRWHSPPGLGLYLSILLHPTVPAMEVARWTLAAAVAACTACRELGGSSVEIEWPNDLVAGGEKIGGILAELRSGATGVSELVLGAGLNVHHRRTDFPEELRERATSLGLLSGGAEGPAREVLAAGYLRRLLQEGAALESGGWSDTMEAWEALAPAARGRQVRLLDRAGAPGGFCGVTDGLHDSGGLQVLGRDGTLRIATMAETLIYLES